MSNSENKESIVTRELVDTLQNDVAQEDLLTEFNRGGSEDNEKTRLVENFIPNEDEWKGKTDIAYHQAHALAVVEALPLAFEEIDDLEPFLEKLIDNYIIYLTSVEGKSRTQISGIFKAMFGGRVEENEETRSMMMSMLGAKEGAENDD